MVVRGRGRGRSRGRSSVLEEDEMEVAALDVHLRGRWKVEDG